MKKKWPLFLLVPLLLILVAILSIYIWKSPKRIKGEYTGTEYSFQGIRFDTVSETLTLNEEVQAMLKENGYSEGAYYDNEDNERLIIMKLDDPENLEFAKTEWQQLQNPFKIIYLELFLKENAQDYSQTLSQEQIGIKKHQIKTYYGDNKHIIYNYSLDEKDREVRNIKVLFDKVVYNIIVKSLNGEEDIQRIIKSINKIN